MRASEQAPEESPVYRVIARFSPPCYTIKKETNHSGGVLGGFSDGSNVNFRVAFKPTPSIAQPQKTVNNNGEDTEITISSRHDPIVVPRAVVVVEAMAAITVADLMLVNMSARIDNIKHFYSI